MELGVFTKPHKPYKLQKQHQNRPQNGITAPHRTASNSAPYRTAWCSAVCRFIIKKTAQTAPHPLYILIYLFIFNIKYIINNLTTLVFKKKKSLITLASID